MEINLNWLQYVANPFSLIAAIAVIAGFSFRAAIGKMQKPKSGFILAMYAMFLLAILLLGLGGVGIYFLFSGPTDEVAKIKFENFPPENLEKKSENLPPKIDEKNLKNVENFGAEKILKNSENEKILKNNQKNAEKIDEKNLKNENFSSTFLFKKPAKNGWIWAGEIEKIREKNFRAIDFAAPEKFIPEKNFEKIKFSQNSKIIFTKKNANLRDAPPEFSWWKLHYKLGNLLEILPQQQRIRILESGKFGQQLWIRAEILPQIDDENSEKIE